jgi:hypothetical protein
MLEEHTRIRAATDKLRVVAQQEKASAYEQFAAILAGDVIRARIAQK